MSHTAVVPDWSFSPLVMLLGVNASERQSLKDWSKIKGQIGDDDIVKNILCPGSPAASGVLGEGQGIGTTHLRGTEYAELEGTYQDHGF